MTTIEHLKRFVEMQKNQREAAILLNMSQSLLSTYLSGKSEAGPAVREKLRRAHYDFGEDDALAAVHESQVVYVPKPDRYSHTKVEITDEGLVKLTIYQLDNAGEYTSVM